MVGLDTIKHLVLQKNNDVIPFFKFITNKYASSGPNQKKNIKQAMQAMSKASAGKNASSHLQGSNSSKQMLM